MTVRSAPRPRRLRETVARGPAALRSDRCRHRSRRSRLRVGSRPRSRSTTSTTSRSPSRSSHQGVGLIVAALALRWLAGGASPSTSDEYIRNFHDKAHPLDLRPAIGRIVASIATLGRRRGPRLRRTIDLHRVGDRHRPADPVPAAVPAHRRQGTDGGRRRGRRRRHLQDPRHRRDLRPGGALPRRHRQADAAPRPGRFGHRLPRLRRHLRHHAAVPHRRLSTVRAPRTGRSCLGGRPRRPLRPWLRLAREGGQAAERHPPPRRPDRQRSSDPGRPHR